MQNWWFLSLLLLLSCKSWQEELPALPTSPAPPTQEDAFVKAVDASFLPEIERTGITLYNETGAVENMLTTLKKAGCNTVRVRLWKNPAGLTSSLAEVQAFAQRIKSAGMKVWLCVHYSDTWADPANQITPNVWQNLPFLVLRDSVYQYTQQIVTKIQPEIIQIGNEINGGFLLPQGSLQQEANFKILLGAGIKAVRDHAPKAKIMLHFAGLANADWFYSRMTILDYDWIGLSYYPLWHGKDLSILSQTLASLKNKYQKEVLIAETSYPFTLGWNDWTNNVVGDVNQLLTAYPATATGQRDYLLQIKQITRNAQAKGFCYWGAEWIAFKGNQAQNGSSWENQAFYDFNNRALPVFKALQD